MNVDTVLQILGYLYLDSSKVLQELQGSQEFPG